MRNTAIDIFVLLVKQKADAVDDEPEAKGSIYILTQNSVNDSRRCDQIDISKHVSTKLSSLPNG
jgi:hypothetical protein